MSSVKRLIIVDVSNFIFRAYFAIQRPMTSPSGIPTKAVFGVQSMMLKMFSEYKPTHLFMARDSKGGSYRNKIYPQYKANRSALPEDLIPQFPLIDRLIELMNLPTFVLEGFEADDIIGSVCCQWKNDFDEIYIASGDKDLMQFVGGNIKLLDTMKSKLYSPSEVEEKMGVRPDQIVDYLSIVGDVSDNIPGMKGIGAVGATKLLAEYGTLENIIAHKDQLKGKKVIEAFNDHLELGLLSKKLVQITTDLNLGHTPEETVLKFYPSNELIDFMKELGFASLVPKYQEMRIQDHLSESGLFKKVESVDLKLMEVNDDNFNEIMSQIKIAKSMAQYLVYESEDIYASKIVRAYLAFNDQQVIVADKTFLYPLIKEIWKNSNCEVIGENLKQDYVHALINNIEFKAPLFDIGLAHFNINTNTRHGVDVLAQEYLQKEMGADEHWSNIKRANALFLLAKILKDKLSELKLIDLYHSIDLKILPVLAKMESVGIGLNVHYLQELEVELDLEIKKIEKEIFEISKEEINLNSPKQVGMLLFEKLQLPVIKKTKTGYSTDAEVLEELDSLNLSSIPGLLLIHREYGKILSTYVRALPELINPKTKRIHTHYNLTVAQTGRLSSTNPNLQNIPIRSPIGQKVRKAFISKPGKILLSADYSQVELRLLAHFSNDATMLKSFADNVDIHTQTASEILQIPLNEVSANDRSIAKSVNFGLMYGQSSFGLAMALKISRNDAKNYIDKYFTRFSSIKKFLDTLKEKTEQTGFAETLHGRKRFLPDIYSQNRTIKAQAERMAINSPIQGTAADIIKLAMIKIDQEMESLNLKSKMLLQVHDELIFEVEEEELAIMKKIVREGMENVVSLKVPLKVEMGIGVNWYDLK